MTDKKNIRSLRSGMLSLKRNKLRELGPSEAQAPVATSQERAGVQGLTYGVAVGAATLRRTMARSSNHTEPVANCSEGDRAMWTSSTF